MSPVIQFTHQPLLEFEDALKRTFRRMEDWAVLIDGDVLVLPKDGLSDGATIPWWAEGLGLDAVDPRIFMPALLHDYLCDNKGDVWPDHHKIYTSAESAVILREAMKACGASFFIGETVYYAVLDRGPQWS